MGVEEYNVYHHSLAARSLLHSPYQNMLMQLAEELMCDKLERRPPLRRLSLEIKVLNCVPVVWVVLN